MTAIWPFCGVYSVPLTVKPLFIITSSLDKITLCDVEATKVDLMNTVVTNNRVLEPWKQFS